MILKDLKIFFLVPIISFFIFFWNVKFNNSFGLHYSIFILFFPSFLFLLQKKLIFSIKVKLFLLFYFIILMHSLLNSYFDKPLQFFSETF